MNATTAQPLRNAKLFLVGRRTSDKQMVAFFESPEGDLMKYEVHGARPPVRLPEAA